MMSTAAPFDAPPPFRSRFVGWLRAAAVVGALILLVQIYRDRERAPRAGVTGHAPVPGKTNLRLLTFWNPPYKYNFDALLAEYMSEHPQVHVVQEAVPASGPGNNMEMLKMQIAAGDPPSTANMSTGELSGPLIDNGMMTPLDDEYEKRGWYRRLTPWAVATLRRNGHIWGVPYATRAIGFWYRTDLFARFGLQVPHSYAALETLCQALVQNQISCLSLGGKFGWNTMRLVEYFLEATAGPVLHDQLNRMEVSWDRPEVIEAYRRLQTWVQNKWISPGFLLISPNDARLPWYRGAAAMVFEGDWIERVIKEDEQPIEHFDFFIPPTDHVPNRFAAFAQQIMIPRGARNKAAILDFIDWYIQPRVQQKYFTGLLASTATLGVVPDSKDWVRQQRWRQVIENAATFLPTDQQFATELMDSWFQVQDALVAEQITPELAARQMQKTIDGWKAQHQPKRPPPETKP